MPWCLVVSGPKIGSVIAIDDEGRVDPLFEDFDALLRHEVEIWLEE